MKEKPMLASDLETGVLDHARRGLSPSASQRRLTLQRLGRAFEALPAATLATLDQPPHSPLPGAPFGKEAPGSGALGTGSTAPAVTSAGHFSLHALVLGVLAGAAVGFGAGVMIGFGAAPEDASSATPRGQGTTIVERGPSEKRGRQDTEPHEVAPLPERASEPAAARKPHNATRRPRQGASPASSASSEAAQITFYEELSYVRRAQSALQQGNAILALGLMQSLDSIRPNGALMAERSMTRVLALCQLERTREAAAIAHDMLQGDRTADVYHQRLATSCAGASLSEARPKAPVKDPVAGDTKPMTSNSDGQEQEANP